MPDKVNNTTTLTDWIAANYQPPKVEGGWLIDAACWFLCCRDAEQMLDGMGVKDLAFLIRNGLGGPVKTLEDVDEWFRDQKDAIYDDEQWDEFDLTDELKEHFGIKR